MNFLFKKQTMIIIIIIALLSVGSFSFYLYQKNKTTTLLLELEMARIADLTPKQEIIGSSIEKRNIEAFTFGNGEKHLLFVGGIHGGYEWNSVLLAYEMIDYLKANPKTIPENLKVTIIPSANPDGLYQVTNKEGIFTINDISTEEDLSPWRFNANEVDLNRNFDCKWQPESTWRNKPVDAGTTVFSEPEAQAIRDFVLENNPVAVIFWHSQANTVYASECENGVLPETIEIMNTYAKAADYNAVDIFDSYTVTGDAEGWLASINIPAITVELENHESIDWTRNLEGVKALFEYYQLK